MTSKTILTTEGIVSYAQNLWKPSRIKDKKTQRETGELKYSCEIIFPAGTDMTLLNDTIRSVASEAFGPEVLTNTPAGFRWPLQKGDTYKPGDPLYKGAWVLRVSKLAEYGPPARVFNDGNYTPIQDQSRLFSGCIVQANITIKDYDMGAASRGVTAFVNGIILIREGEHLDGGQTAAQMFADVTPGTSSPGAPPAGQQAPEESAAPQAADPWG